MSDARTTLEVVLKATGFDTGAASIKKLGDEATTANAKLKTTADVVDKTAKSSATIGSKLKNAGSQFSTMGTAAATTALSVVSLSRSYRDLEDSQIAVDKTTRRVSLAQEAYRKATDAVAKAIASGGKGSAAYKQALLDQQQALAKVNIALKDQGEALERQGDINQDFWLSLGTTALAGTSTVMGALSKLGGEQGLGGIASKLKGLGSGGFAGLSGLTAALGPLALAALAAGVAFIAYDNAMKKVAEAKSEQTLAKNAKTLADELDHTKKSFDALKLKPGTNIVDFFSSLGPGGLQNTFVKMAEDAKIKEIELKTETEALTAAKEKLNKALADPALKSHVTSIADAAKKTVELAQAEVKRLQTINDTIPASEKLSSSMTATNKAMGANTTLLDTMTKPFTGNSVFYTMAQNVDQLKASFVALNQEADRSQFMKLLSQGNLSATTKKTPLPTFNQPALDADWFIGSWVEASDSFDKGFQDMAKASDDAARKIKTDQAAAAREVQAAWDKAFGSQVSGIDKIFAAYHKLHPGGSIDTKKGTRTFAPGQLPIDIANKAFEALESGLAQKLSSPASAKTYVTNWIATAAGHMKGVAGQLLAPITEYINAHKSEAPETFMSGFLQFLNTFNLTDAFSKAFLPVVTVAGETGTTAAGAITTGLGKVDVTPLQEKMKLGAEAAGLVTKGINKIPKKVTSTVNIIANLAQANAKWQAFARKVQGTTLQVKIAGSSVNIRKGSQAGAYGGPKASGYSGTVTRPTHFLVGEGGRPEDVYIKPKGSAGQRPEGGGFNGTINVYLDGEPITRGMRYKINENQGVVK